MKKVTECYHSNETDSRVLQSVSVFAKRKFAEVEFLVFDCSAVELWLPAINAGMSAVRHNSSKNKL